MTLHTKSKLELILIGGLTLSQITAAEPVSNSLKPVTNLNLDNVYAIHYDGDEVGYHRVIVRPMNSNKENKPYTELIAEISEATIESFFGDTHIYTSKIELYDAQRQIAKGDYATLYDDYLLLSKLELTSTGRLKQADLIYEISEPQLSQLRTGWKQSFESQLPLADSQDQYVHYRNTFKPMESNLSFVDPRNFDMTQTYLSIHLLEKTDEKKENTFRILNPELDNDESLYEVSARFREAISGAELESAVSTSKSNTKFNTKVIELRSNNEVQAEYFYETSRNQTQLVKVIDLSDDERVEMILKNN